MIQQPSTQLGFHKQCEMQFIDGGRERDTKVSVMRLIRIQWQHNKLIIQYKASR